MINENEKGRPDNERPICYSMPLQNSPKLCRMKHKYYASTSPTGQSISITEVISSFRLAASERRILVPVNPVTGRIARCPVEGKSRRNDSGRYLLFLDKTPAGGFQNMADGQPWEKWRFHFQAGGNLTPVERLRYKAWIEANRKQREAAEARRHSETALQAARIWASAKTANPHNPYCKKKGILPPPGVREQFGRLVVPIYGYSGELWNLQFIDGVGTKRFLPGGRLSGGCYCIGKVSDKPGTVCVCEGLATAASVHMATGYPVFVAFSSGNLESVAVSLRARYPKSKIVLAADNDWRTAQKIGRNPGIEAAKRAAAVCGGCIAFPPSADGVSDFNDLAQSERR